MVPELRDWMRRTGWQRSSDGPMCVWSFLVPAAMETAAPVEVRIQCDEEHDACDVSLHQGYPDDPNGRDDCVLLTGRGYDVEAVKNLLRLLGADVVKLRTETGK